MSALLSTLVHPGVVADLRWNPTFRGILFPSILFLVLCGSCYVILATNIGNRLGFLLSSAAFWGWMSLMTIAWMIYGIGLRGPDPKWVVQEAIKDTRSAQVEKVTQIPNTPTKIVPKDWKVVKEGVPMRGEAQSAIDAYLAPAPKKVDYVAVSGFESGGAQRIKVWPKVVKGGKWYNPGDYAFRGLLHSKHYYVGQVQPMLTQPKKVGDKIQYDSKGVALTEPVVKDGKNVADTTKPITTVVLIRDLGSRRQPPFFIFCASFVLLLLSLFNLHRRDKQVMTAMGQLKPQGA
jgi:hypothetical protein